MRILITILTVGLLTAFQISDRTIEQFVQSQLNAYAIIQNDESQYFTYSLEKLNLHKEKKRVTIKANNTHSNKNSYNKTVYSRIHIWQFDFASKEKCGQAIDSLLNCFPNDCGKIKRNNDQGLKITPSIWILTDTKIYIAKTACEQVDEKWTDFKKKFTASFSDNETEIIVTECGKLTWTTKEKIKNAP